MVIYLDLLFLLNLIYDFLLLMTVSITLKIKASIKRLLIGSLVGGFSTFIIILPFNSYILLILKIIMGFILLLVTFGYKNHHYFLNNLIYLYMCSVILGGFLYFLKMEFANFSYLIVLVIGPFILAMYIKMQKKLKEIYNFRKNVLITFKNNKVLELTGFIDSGNRLVDPITKKYIILINKNKLKGIYNIRSPIYVPIKTVNKCSILKCISIKNIIVDGKIYNDYLVGLTDLNSFSGVDCLLNFHLLEKGN